MPLVQLLRYGPKAYKHGMRRCGVVLVEAELTVLEDIDSILGEVAVINGFGKVDTGGIEVMAELHGNGVVAIEAELEEGKGTLTIGRLLLEEATAVIEGGGVDTYEDSIEKTQLVE